MLDNGPPARKRWIQFTLRDCLIASLAIAATIAPLKLYERFNPPSRQVTLQAVIYEADAAKLGEFASSWKENQWCAKSKDEVGAVTAELAKIKAEVTTTPTMVTLDGREATFSIGWFVPMVMHTKDKKSSITPGEVGSYCSVRPLILPNGRVQMHVKFQKLSKTKDVDWDGMDMAPAYVELKPHDEDPDILVRKMSFPAELAVGDTVFFCDSGNRRKGKGTVIQLQVTNVK